MLDKCSSQSTFALKVHGPFVYLSRLSVVWVSSLGSKKCPMRDREMNFKNFNMPQSICALLTTLLSKQMKVDERLWLILYWTKAYGFAIGMALTAGFR